MTCSNEPHFVGVPATISLKMPSLPKSFLLDLQPDSPDVFQRSAIVICWTRRHIFVVALTLVTRQRAKHSCHQQTQHHLRIGRDGNCAHLKAPFNEPLHVTMMRQPRYFPRLLALLGPGIEFEIMLAFRLTAWAAQEVIHAFILDDNVSFAALNARAAYRILE